MAFKVNQKQSESPEMLASQAGLASGMPLLVTVDEIIDDRSIKATLIIAGLNTPEGTRVTIEQAPAAREYRSLSQAIKGTEKTPALRKGEVICFNDAYINKGRAAVGAITARTHDNLRGDIQVMSCMAKLSKSSVSAKGATQYVTILNPAKAVNARSLAEVEAAWGSVLTEKWPGGEPGFLIRDKLGGGIEWFLKKGENFKALLEELTYQEVFKANGSSVELIPAWSLPAGREQITQDVDVRHETDGPRFGPVSKLFQFDEKKGRSGFVASLAIIAEEEEFAFGGPTGKVVKAVVGLQPCFRKSAVDPMKVPSAVDAHGGKVNGILKLYSDEKVAELKAGRIARRGPDREPVAPSNKNRASSQPTKPTGQRQDDVDEEYSTQPKKPVFMGKR